MIGRTEVTARADALRSDLFYTSEMVTASALSLLIGCMTERELRNESALWEGVNRHITHPGAALLVELIGDERRAREDCADEWRGRERR